MKPAARCFATFHPAEPLVEFPRDRSVGPVSFLALGPEPSSCAEALSAAATAIGNLRARERDAYEPTTRLIGCPCKTYSDRLRYLTSLDV